jgi:hypothetical protein
MPTRTTQRSVRRPFEEISEPTVPLFIRRPPQTPDELHAWYRAVLGVNFPRHACCAEHSSPFSIAEDMYFRRHPVIVVKASRGVGKSFTLAAAVIGTSILQGVYTTVLGGSAAQSLNVTELSQQFWVAPYAPRSLLVKEPTRYDTYLRNGGHIRALMASSRSVRGQHPNVLVVDEADELPDISLLDAAQGMPSVQTSSAGQDLMPITILSSTHHYPDGPMAEILRRAEEKNWPTKIFCWRCILKPHGWMMPEFIVQKRQEMTATAFAVEFDLADPAVRDGIIHPELVAYMWDENQGSYEGRPGEVIRLEEPRYGVEYVHGVDWAKKRDWTVHTIWRPDVDTNEWHLVYFHRTNRLPWPEMVGAVMRELQNYPGSLGHDATGVGDVIGDLFPEEARQQRNVRDIIMRGEVRSQMFEDYIRAVESKVFRAPRIKWAFQEMLYCQYEDLHSSSGHPPDSIVSGSMAWLMRDSSFDWDFDTPNQDFSFGPTQGVNGWVMEQQAGASMVGTGWRI